MAKEQYAKCRECENGKIKIIIAHLLNGDIIVNTSKCDNCNYDLDENDFVDLLAGKFLNGAIGSEDDKSELIDKALDWYCPKCGKKSCNTHCF